MREGKSESPVRARGAAGGSRKDPNGNQSNSQVRSNNTDLECVKVPLCDNFKTLKPSLTSAKLHQQQPELLAEENLKLTRKVTLLEQQIQRFSSSASHLYPPSNTSSGYELPSEFKTQWDSFLKDQVIEAFGDCFQQPVEVLTGIIGIAQKVAIEENQRQYREMVERVRVAIGVERSSEVVEDLENSMRPFLRNHYRKCSKGVTSALVEKFYGLIQTEITENTY